MDMNMELYEKLAKLQWLLHRQHLKIHAFGGPMADTSRGQGRILAMLKLKDGISTKDLSFLLGIRVSSLNELLAKLEKNGYITRKRSETDKRVMLIYLTEKGKEVKEPKQDNISEVFNCLSADEQATFGEYLDRIIAALEEQLGIDDEQSEMLDRLRDARSRKGKENFEKLLAMRGFKNGWRFKGGFFPYGHGGGPHAFGRYHDGRGYAHPPFDGDENVSDDE
jgi:DNA-binding MarR family transcriptional regulator